MKDKIKKWLVENERLYWFIVIALAVFAFGLITAIGCAKVEKAQAAETTDGVHYLDLATEVDWGDFEQYKETILNRNSDLIVTRGKVDDYNTVYYYLLDSQSYVSSSTYNGATHYWIYTHDYITVYNGVVKYCEMEKNQLVGIYYEGSGWSIIGSTFDYRGSASYAQDWVHSNLEYYGVPSATTEFLVNAPYIVFDSLKIENPVGTGQYFSSDLTEHDWTYNGHIGGQPMDVQEYVLSYALRVKLPSEKYIYMAWDKYYGVWETFRDYVDVSVLEWSNDYLYDDEMTCEYVLPFSVTLTVDENGCFDVHRDSEHIYDAIVECYGGYLTGLELENTLLTSADEKYNNWFLPWAFAHMYVNEISGVLYSRVDDATIYYGRYVMNSFSFGVQNRCVAVEVTEDYVNTDSETFGDILGTNTEIAFGNALKEIADKNNQLQSELDDIYVGNNAYSDLASSDLWGYAKNTADGLLGSLGTVTALASVVAVLFSFIPAASLGVISTVFVVGLICAVISFIRGK